MSVFFKVNNFINVIFSVSDFWIAMSCMIASSPSRIQRSSSGAMSHQYTPPAKISQTRHILQNTLLILLSLFFLPFSTFFILIPCLLRSCLLTRKIKIPEEKHGKPLTILVTSTEMTKGLVLCRAFKACGYRVIGADVVHEKPIRGGIERSREKEIMHKILQWFNKKGITFRIPSPGRFSRSLDSYYLLPDPRGEIPILEENNNQNGHTTTSSCSRQFNTEVKPNGSTKLQVNDNETPHVQFQSAYPDECTSTAVRVFANTCQTLISRENISLWVPVSSVNSTVEESQSARLFPPNLREKQLILPPFLAQTLHEKDSFIEHTAFLGLAVPESHVCTSTAQVLKILYGESRPNTVDPQPIIKKKFILKCIPLDDVSRANLLLYPRPNYHQTVAMVCSQGISPDKPFLLQEFISGKEYTTHSVIIRGRVTAFVACESSELLMHYIALDPNTREHRAMLAFTEKYASQMGSAVSGQVSFDFLIPQDRGEDVKLYPIECNPRTHTAVVLFRHDPQALTDAYLSLLPNTEPSADPESATRCPRAQGQARGYYWIGHDLVTLVLLPLVDLLTMQGLMWEQLKAFVISMRQFLSHVIWWREAVWDSEDPLPWWWLYHVYWPCVFAGCLLTGRKWSRVNVSTGRVFECE